MLVDTTRLTAEDLRVGGVLTTINHNLKVFMAFLVVGFIFSYLGIMFVIVYNAAIWGLTMVNAMAGTDMLGASKVAAAILPHLVLEIAAYTLAAMSGVFWSRLSRYRWLSPRLNRIASGISQLLLLGAIMVTVGATIEYFWGGWLLADNSPGIPAIGHLTRKVLCPGSRSRTLGSRQTLQHQYSQLEYEAAATYGHETHCRGHERWR